MREAQFSIWGRRGFELEWTTSHCFTIGENLSLQIKLKGTVTGEFFQNPDYN
jgi:hypothetical protein